MWPTLLAASIRRWFSRTKPRPEPQGAIDPKIKPLVDAMNAVAGIRTVASCQGHSYGIEGKPPYVYFKAPLHLAARLEKRLREEGVSAARLRAGWEIVGRFDHEYQLTYLLYSPGYHRVQYTLAGALWHFWLRRRRLDAELTYLTGLVQQLDLVLEFGNGNEPQQEKAGDNHGESNQLA